LGLPISAGDIDEIIVVILCQNGPRQRCLRHRFDSVQEIGTLSMNEPDEGMNLVVFTVESRIHGQKWPQFNFCATSKWVKQSRDSLALRFICHTIIEDSELWRGQTQ
jgi:hypothetical protein